MLSVVKLNAAASGVVFLSQGRTTLLLLRHNPAQLYSPRRRDKIGKTHVHGNTCEGNGLHVCREL